MEKVCVLLSTYNGVQFLDEQVKSLLAQKGVNLTVLVRDDGSKDETNDMLHAWAEKDKSIVILEKENGTNYGVAKSFTYLLNNADVMFPETRFFFFCDQDDVWHEEKCLRAVNQIAQYSDREALYFSGKKLVDSNLQPLKKKDEIRLHGSFWDYFDRSNAYGCTMCLTRPLVELLRNDQYYNNTGSFLHDNYIFRLCLAAGFPIIGDKTKTILYRQHDSNVAGAAKRHLFRGVKKIFDKNRAHPVREISECLMRNQKSALKKENVEILKLFLDSEKSFKSKRKLMSIYRRQAKRGLKDRLVFDMSIMLNYY